MDPALFRRAIEDGFYGGGRIAAGTVFNLLHANHHQPRWMETVPPDTKLDVRITRLTGAGQHPVEK